MALKIGNNAVANAFVGSSQVRRAYKGGTLVYQGWGPSSEREFVQLTSPGGPSELLKVYGKTIVNNQLVQNYDFSDGTTGWTAYRATASVTGGVATITPTVTDNTAGFATPIAAGTKWIEGHKYAIICRVKGNVGKTINFSAYYGALSGVSAITPTGDWQTSAQIKTATATEAAFTALRVALAQAADANLSPYYCNYIKVIDLTLLYGAGHEPASVAAFLADYPTFDPTYNPGSLQSNKTAELRAERVPIINIWDEQWEVGLISGSTGQPIPGSDYIRAKNFCACLPNTAYYVRISATHQLRLYWYDASKGFISAPSAVYEGGVLTTPANCYYFKLISWDISYGTTYRNDICINVSDPAINGTYYPHWRGKLTLNLSTLTSGGVVVYPDGLRGVGSIRDEAEGSTAIKRIGRVNLGDLSWIKTEVSPSNIFFRAANVPSDAAFGNDAAAICANYPVVIGGAGAVSFVDKTITFGSPGNYNGILVKDSAYNDAAAFKAAMNGVYLDYKLATPLTYTLDTPLPTDLTCVQGDILQRVSDNNCPFVGEMKFGL